MIVDVIDMLHVYLHLISLGLFPLLLLTPLPPSCCVNLPLLTIHQIKPCPTLYSRLVAVVDDTSLFISMATDNKKSCVSPFFLLFVHRLKDKSYLMRLGSQVYIDAKDHENVLARYINDCKNQFGYNVHLKKLPDEAKALVIASRDIAPGEELYLNYGRWYWLSHACSSSSKDEEGQVCCRLSLKDLLEQQMKREEQEIKSNVCTDT